MRHKSTSLDQNILDCLNANYGIQATALKLLAIGADINASVYKTEAADRQSYFVKVKTGHAHDISLNVHTELYNAGIEQIIPPIKTLDGHLSKYIGEFTLTVYPYIQGQDGFSRNLTENQWLMLGKALRQIHEFKVPAYILGQLRKETYSDKWRRTVQAIENLTETKSYTDQWALKLSQLIKNEKSTILRLVDTAEELSQKIRKHSPDFVLCHADIHAGNIIITDNGSIFIVDWDDPILAPKERDLMFIGGGVANVWNQPREEVLFYKGYGKTSINQEIIAYYRHERIVEDIAEYCHCLLLNDAGDDRDTMYQHFAAMFEPRGVVEIAFQTIA